VANMQAEVFEAFRAIDIPEDKALKAATALSKRDDDVASIKSDVLLREQWIDARLVFVVECTEEATADLVRWQLDGWLSNRTSHHRPTAPVTLLRLQAVEVVSAEALQLPLWGGLGEEDRLRARRALVRVQGLLGPEAVQVPVLSGGRGPAERITLTPLGDEPVPQSDPSLPWPGQLPDPSPAVLLDDPVELVDAQGNPIRVTSRGMFSADPARLVARGRDDPLRWWAGPWPVDERWWDPDLKRGRTARVQVLLESERALLLCYRQRRWYLEGSYE